MAPGAHAGHVPVARRTYRVAHSTWHVARSTWSPTVALDGHRRRSSGRCAQTRGEVTPPTWARWCPTSEPSHSRCAGRTTPSTTSLYDSSAARSPFHPRLWNHSGPRFYSCMGCVLSCGLCADCACVVLCCNTVLWVQRRGAHLTLYSLLEVLCP